MENRATSAKVARTAELQRLVDLLGDWSGATGPLYRHLARAIIAAVERGDLPRGARLPSERALARAISVSRGVVVGAYDQLVADDVIERRAGSGTFVAGSAGTGLPPGREGSGLVRRFVERERAPEVIDLSISVLRDAPGLPRVRLDSTRLAIAGADSPWGLAELRERIASRLTAIGLASTAAQIVVTTGAQQGLSLAAGCWLRPGDEVAIDDPTYPGALSAVVAAGAVPVPVPVDAKGPVLSAFEAALQRRPALAYVQSGVHSPTGGRLSPHRRQAIAALVREHRVPLVEDHALYAVDWSGAPPPAPIASHAPEHPIAVVGSYSKRFWGGLRVGFVRAPEPVAARLVRMKATHDLGSSVAAQALALELLDHRDHDRYVARRNAELAAQAGLLVGLLRAELPTWRSTVPDGGLSLWVRLPEPVASRLAEVALRHGVAVATAEGLAADPGAHRDRLRLTFALPEAHLREAVARLAVAWDEVVRGGRR